MQFCDESVRELHFTTDGLPVIGDNNSPDFDELALENLDFHTEDPAHTRARHGFYGGDFVSGEDLWDGRPSAEDILCDISDALFEIECSDEDDNITVDTLELEAEEIEAEEWIARALRLRSLAEMEIVQRYGVSPEWLATVEEGELGVNTLALIAEAAKAAKALGIDWSVIEEATRPTEMMELVSKLQTQAQELRRAKAQAERDAARKPAPSSKGKGKRRQATPRPATAIPQIAISIPTRPQPVIAPVAINVPNSAPPVERDDLGRVKVEDGFQWTCTRQGCNHTGPLADFLSTKRAMAEKPARLLHENIVCEECAKKIVGPEWMSADEVLSLALRQVATWGTGGPTFGVNVEGKVRQADRSQLVVTVPSDLAEVLATIKWYEVQGEVRWGHIRRGEQVDWKTCREAGVGQDSWMKGILKTVELSTDSTNGSCHFCLDWLLRLQRDQKQRQKQFANRFGHQGYGARA